MRKKQKKIDKKEKFKIIIVRNNKQIQYKGFYRKFEHAIKAFNFLIKENQEKVIFPLKYINTKGIKPCKDEICLLQQVENKENSITLLRNEYGQFVKCYTINLLDTDEGKIIDKYNTATHENWAIINKNEWLTEESFWVYGFHPRKDRKNFSFIYSTFIYNAFMKKRLIPRLIVYKNKLIADYGSDMNITFCKNQSDACRLYEALKNKSDEDKLKGLLWCGIVNDKNNASYWLDKLQEKTGFNRVKLKRPNLRP